MKYILSLLIIFFIAEASIADSRISESQVKKFLDDWLVAQNTGSYSDYSSKYSTNFIGIRRSGASTYKLNYHYWLKDRKKMLKKKIIVKAINPEIKLSGPTATVRFEQIWETDGYRDKGDKSIELILEHENLKITREEMLSSTIVNNDSDNKNINECASQITNNTDGFLTYGHYTSIMDKDCSDLQEKMRIFLGYDSGSECPAPKGWRLFKLYDSERSLLAIAHGNYIWPTGDLINDESNKFGIAPNIYSQRVEWRITKSGVPTALIFRVVAQNTKASSGVSRLFVISLKSGIPRFCGMVKSTQEARDIADKPATCTKTLREIKIPKQ